MDAEAIFHQKPAYKEAPRVFVTPSAPMPLLWPFVWPRIKQNLFHIKAKIMDGVLQNDAVQDAFQVPPPHVIGMSGSIDVGRVIKRHLREVATASKRKDKLDEYIEEATASTTEKLFYTLAV